MRDGLHHGAPVGRRWKHVIRTLSERADYCEAGCRSLSAALLAEIESELRPSFVGALTEEIRAECGKLFSGLARSAGREPPVGLRNDLNDAEQAVTSAARRRIRSGADPDAIVRSALGDLVQERLDSNRRQIFAHVRTESPGDAGAFQRRWSHAERDLNTAQLASKIVDKTAHTVTRAKEPQLDLEADLLRWKP